MGDWNSFSFIRNRFDVSINELTTNFAYRLFPSLNSSFAKRPLVNNAADDVLFAPMEEELGSTLIEDNLEGYMVFWKSVFCSNSVLLE